MNAFPTRAQRGAALVTALVLMLALLVTCLSAVRAALADEKSARAERDRMIALQSAEAALADAERDVEGAANPASSRAVLLAQGRADAFSDACGHDGAGLCGHSEPPAWQRADLADPAVAVEYGRFTGAALPDGAGMAVRAPHYIIELLPVPGAGPSAGVFYRITALGFGSRETTRVVLQSCYRKPAPPAGRSPPALPAGRISWREVANWPELHAAANP